MGTNIGGYQPRLVPTVGYIPIYLAALSHAVSVPIELQRKKAGTGSQIHSNKVNYCEKKLSEFIGKVHIYHLT